MLNKIWSFLFLSLFLGLTAFSCKEPVKKKTKPVRKYNPYQTYNPTKYKKSYRGRKHRIGNTQNKQKERRQRKIPPSVLKTFILTKKPKIQFKINANFENKIMLLGLDVSRPILRKGGIVDIRFYFQCLAPMSKDWQIFIHLDDVRTGGRQRSHGDHHPVFGQFKTTKWKPGMIVVDVKRMRLHPAFMDNQAILWMGWYIGGQRLKILPGVPTDGQNRLRTFVFKVQRQGGPPMSANLHPGAIKGTGPAHTTVTTPATRSKNIPVTWTNRPIRIDGLLTDQAWREAPSTPLFVRAVGGGEPRRRTWAKLLWDNENLYVAMNARDRDIRSRYTKRDDTLWLDDVFEIFIDADSNQKTYVELQVSPANVLFDAYFPTYGPPGRRGGDKSYNPKVRVAVKVNGTLNRSSDMDRGWIVEMAIPFKEIRATPRIPPRPGDKWRFNMFRINRLKASGLQDDAALFPTGGDYHQLDAMGNMIFTAKHGPAKAKTQPKSTSKVK